jgi:beta-glucanase (GH16 family)
LQTSDFEEDAAGRQVVRNKFAQKYGWFEIRCRMCSGSGLCSAFWLLQTDPLDQEFTLEHRRRGLGDGVVEIDIFEQLGKDNAAGLNWFNVHFTESGHREYSAGFELSREFHTWALEWKEGELIWYLDGRRVWTYKGETPKKEMGIFLSLYRGADEFRGAMDPGLTYPRDFEIDYVRVYERL